MRGRIFFVATLLSLTLPGLVVGQNFSRNVGLQLSTGLGITNGRNIKEDLRRDQIDPDLFDPSAGASVRFGVAARVRVVQNLYIEPEFLLSFFNQQALGEDLQLQFEDGTVAEADMKMDWSNTDMAFGIGPVYYLRLRGSPVHPLFGLGFRMRFFKSGDVKTGIRFKDPQLTQFNQSFTIKASEAWEHGRDDQSSVTTMALALKTGAEIALPGGMAIPFILTYELNFSSLVSNVFRIETGFAFYF